MKPFTKLLSLAVLACPAFLFAAGPPRQAPAWPRKVVSGDTTLTVYPPQADRWEGDRLHAGAGVRVDTKASEAPTFGLASFTARTAVDKGRGAVTLTEVEVEGVRFPGGGKSDDYLALVRKALPGSAGTVPLEALKASRDREEALAAGRKVGLKNDPPRVFFSRRPSVLILLDGRPALRRVAGTDVERVLNTRGLLLFDPPGRRYYFHLADRFLEAGSLAGPWSVARRPPLGVLSAASQVTSADLFEDPDPEVKGALERGESPAVFVSMAPAELVQTRGDPEYEEVKGTRLRWLRNSTSQVLVDGSSGDHYLLLSGRWFRAGSMKGPWEYVPGDKLPADFGKIPPDHPKGDVLASVPGTAQARALRLANRVPHTATVKRRDAQLWVLYDGEPRFEPIEGTPLAYAVNTASAVIRVRPDLYYALQDGVWFTASAPEGYWEVADSVPAVIYTIPPSCPLYYVTGCFVYGATPAEVYLGYTPGYLGLYEDAYGCVVYGTGWGYEPWVGAYWFGRPWTYGLGINSFWSRRRGWGFGFGSPVGFPWWGAYGLLAGRYRGSPWYGTRGWAGWVGRDAGAYPSRFFGAHTFNAYDRWGRGAAPRAAAPLPGVSVLPYRRGAGGWEVRTTSGAWHTVNPGLTTMPRLGDRGTLRTGPTVFTPRSFGAPLSGFTPRVIAPAVSGPRIAPGVSAPRIAPGPPGGFRAMPSGGFHGGGFHGGGFHGGGHGGHGGRR
jgi:hypothetical protein